MSEFQILIGTMITLFSLSTGFFFYQGRQTRQELGESRRESNTRFDQVDRRFGEMQTRIDERFSEMQNQIDLRFDQVDRRFSEMQNQIDLRFDQVDRRFSEMQTQIDGRSNEMQSHVDGRFNETQNRIDRRHDRTEDDMKVVINDLAEVRGALGLATGERLRELAETRRQRP